MKVLRRGMSGAAVSGLQQALLDKGFDPGLIDGAFGGGTEAAVLAFQKSEGLLADGIAGPRTLNALRLVASPALPDVTGAVTVEMVSRMFPFTAGWRRRPFSPPCVLGDSFPRSPAGDACEIMCCE